MPIFLIKTKQGTCANVTGPPAAVGIRHKIFQRALQSNGVCGNQNVPGPIIRHVLQKFAQSISNVREWFHTLRCRVVDKVREKHLDGLRRVVQVDALIRTVVHFSEQVVREDGRLVHTSNNFCGLPGTN